MLTYTPKPVTAVPRTNEYPWLLLLLVLIWLWPGVFQHDLWKPGELGVMQAVDEMAANPRWLPTLYGEPYFGVSPVYIHTAAFFRRLLSPWLTDAYSAARFASVLFGSIGLFGAGMAGYRFLGRHHGRSVVLILIGSIGLLPIAHFLGAHSPTFAGVGLAMWGYAIAPRQAVFGAVWLALGTTLVSQSAGFAAALLLLLAGSLQFLFAPWRTPRYFASHLGAWCMTLPLLTLYPLALFLTAPSEFSVYLQQHLFGSYGGTRQVQAAFQLGYYATHSLWFTFPAWPLAVWTLSRKHQSGSRVQTWVLSYLVLFGLFLACNPERNQDLLVLVLPPLALLGAAQLDRLRRGAAAFLNWFGGAVFGAAALFLWMGFVAMNYGIPAKLASRAIYFSPYYTPAANTAHMAVALLFTVMWLVAVTRKRIRGRQAITNWAAGITLVWALLMTLFLPWIDAAKSYRPPIQQLRQSQSAVLQRIAAREECVSISPQHFEARHAWQQYAALPYQTEPGRCRYIFAQYNPQQTRPEHTVLWEGARPRSKTEHFVLLQR